MLTITRAGGDVWKVREEGGREMGEGGRKEGEGGRSGRREEGGEREGGREGGAIVISGCPDSITRSVYTEAVLFRVS